VSGDALANLLAFAGYAVTREYYIKRRRPIRVRSAGTLAYCATAKLSAKISAISRKA